MGNGPVVLNANQNLRADSKCKRSLDLGLLVLDAPDTAGAVHHRVLWHDLARVDLATRANDAAAGEDHVPAKISWKPKDAQQPSGVQKGSDFNGRFSVLKEEKKKKHKPRTLHVNANAHL